MIVNAFLGNELEGGPANLYLRRRADPIAWIPLLLATATAHADGALRALRIDAASQPALSPGGADATGGAGDWALTNGVLCAVVARGRGSWGQRAAAPAFVQRPVEVA